MKKVCETCAGSGQISYFKGVSRFLLSWEECPACSGTGYQLEKEKNGNKKNITDRGVPLNEKKKRGGRKK